MKNNKKLAKYSNDSNESKDTSQDTSHNTQGKHKSLNSKTVETGSNPVSPATLNI